MSSETKYKNSVFSAKLYNDQLKVNRFLISRHFLKKKLKSAFEREPLDKCKGFFNVPFIPNLNMFNQNPTNQNSQSTHPDLNINNGIDKKQINQNQYNNNGNNQKPMINNQNIVNPNLNKNQIKVEVPNLKKNEIFSTQSSGQKPQIVQNTQTQEINYSTQSQNNVVKKEIPPPRNNFTEPQSNISIKIPNETSMFKNTLTPDQMQFLQNKATLQSQNKINKINVKTEDNGFDQVNSYNQEKQINFENQRKGYLNFNQMNNYQKIASALSIDPYDKQDIMIKNYVQIQMPKATEPIIKIPSNDDILNSFDLDNKYE